jgi:hypothetical protein
LGIVAANDSLANIDRKVDKLVETMFMVMRTPEEKELFEFIVNKGGPDVVLKSDLLLKDVQQRQESLGEDTTRRNDSQLFEDFRIEVKMDIGEIIEGNKAFDMKFDEQRRQIEEVKTVVKRESDRVIEAVLAGPHSRIVNRVSAGTRKAGMITNLTVRIFIMFGRRW